MPKHQPHLAIYTGSFDPPTFGHLDVISRSRHIFDEVIVAIGRNIGKREIFPLMQRKAKALGKGLGKTTGWIHRASLKMKEVEMVGGVNYERIDDAGLHVTVDGKASVIPADTVILCAGQVPERSLADALNAAGIACHVIGGADVAAELDAKRAIDQGVRLAATL